MSDAWEGFWIVHSRLEREGPGAAEDVAWACAAAGIGRDARICDAAGGPGADVAALRRAAPEGEVVTFDKHLPFVAEAALRHRGDARVTPLQGVLVDDGSGLPDPAALGPFDLIWCAGALYFTGAGAALRAWAPALAEGGAAAFSYPCNWAGDDAETRAFWEMPFGDEAALDAVIEGAGWEVLARSRVSRAGWEGYFAAVEARCAALEGLEAPSVRAAIARERREAAEFARLSDRLGYALRVVRPARA
jgi:SAM-dependent methyltransferase